MFLDNVSPVRVIQELQPSLYQGKCYLLWTYLLHWGIYICFSLSQRRLMQGQLGQKKRQWRSQLLTTIRNISNENRQNLRVKIIQTNKNLPLPKTVFLFSMTYISNLLNTVLFLCQYFMYVQYQGFFQTVGKFIPEIPGF